MARIVEGLEGRRFGYLVAVKIHEYRPQKRGTIILWECLCDCGKTIVTEGYRLLRTKARSCGCKNNRFRLEAIKKTDRICILCANKYTNNYSLQYCSSTCRKLSNDFQQLDATYHEREKYQCRKDKYLANVYYLSNMLKNQNFCCALCVIEMKTIDISFDHIVPSSKGGETSIYNIQLVHKQCNQMKSNATTQELLDWCVNVLKHNKMGFANAFT